MQRSWQTRTRWRSNSTRTHWAGWRRSPGRTTQRPSSRSSRRERRKTLLSSTMWTKWTMRWNPWLTRQVRFMIQWIRQITSGLLDHTTLINRFRIHNTSLIEIYILSNLGFHYFQHQSKTCPLLVCIKFQLNPCKGKFCQNTGKAEGILFPQVVNSLNLKIQDIVIFAANLLPIFIKSVSQMKLAQISEITIGRISSWTGNNSENTGN